MISRKSLACAIVALCLFHPKIASAQPRWGHDRQPQVGACFYEDIHFQGRYFCVRPGEHLRSLPSGMGDKISSVRLLGAAELTVFRDSNMHGRSARFTNDVNDLRRGGWNDQISSIEVGHGRGGGGEGGGGGGWHEDRPPVWGNEVVPREGACFYRDSDFRGQYFCIPRGGTYRGLPRGFNDSISSIRVFRARVKIFQNENFNGRSTDIHSDVHNLRGNWKDTVSSIRVF